MTKVAVTPNGLMIISPSRPEDPITKLMAILINLKESYIESLIRDESRRDTLLELLDNTRDAEELPKFLSSIRRKKIKTADIPDPLWNISFLERVNEFTRDDQSRSLLDTLLSNWDGSRRYRER